MNDARNWSIIEEVYEQAIPGNMSILLLRCSALLAIPKKRKTREKNRRDYKKTKKSHIREAVHKHQTEVAQEHPAWRGLEVEDLHRKHPSPGVLATKYSQISILLRIRR